MEIAFYLNVFLALVILTVLCMLLCYICDRVGWDGGTVTFGLLMVLFVGAIVGYGVRVLENGQRMWAPVPACAAPPPAPIHP